MLKKNQTKSRKKNITEQIKKTEASENLFNKNIKEFLELDKKNIWNKGQKHIKRLKN